MHKIISSVVVDVAMPNGLIEIYVCIWHMYAILISHPMNSFDSKTSHSQ